MRSAVREYLRAVGKTLAAGNATEHSYRPALKTLVEALATNITATNEPKRVKCGAPDFIVSRGDLPIGYIECKDLGLSLDEVEITDQLKRYLDGLNNLILTDYVEFRYYVAGQRAMQAVLARVDAKSKVRPIQGAESQLASMFDAFFSAQTTTIKSPKELAARMANIAKIIRDAIERAFALESEGGTLHGEFKSFRATILNDITPSSSRTCTPRRSATGCSRPG